MTGPGAHSELGAKPRPEGRNRQCMQCQTARGFISLELLNLRRGAYGTLLSRSSPSPGCAVFPQWPDLGLDHGAFACEPGHAARGKCGDALLGTALSWQFLGGLFQHI